MTTTDRRRRTDGVRWWIQDTPIDPILVVAGDTGLRRIHFRADVADAPIDAVEARDPAVARALDAWFAGQERHLDVSLDWTGVDGFRRTALETLRAQVGWGETVTYGELAAMAGSPRAARAVGTAMAANPFPFVVPCHRVVASNGLGGYGGTADTATRNLVVKRWLLRNEGVDI